MPKKEDVIRSLDKGGYTRSEVASLLQSVASEPSKPLRLKRGDVFTSRIGAKFRPVVIVKVVDDIVLGIPLSTTEDCLNLMPSKSRFFGEGFFNRQMVTATYDYAMSAFVGVYDDEKRVRKAVRTMKKFYSEVL